MDLVTVTLPIGGFGSLTSAIYALLINHFVYIGITGTSNKTGLRSPHERLGTHITKRGKTKSALWDLVIAKGLIPKEKVVCRMLSTFVPAPLRASQIERATIYRLTSIYGNGVMLNQPVKRPPADLLSEEMQFFENFASAIQAARRDWMLPDGDVPQEASEVVNEQ